ncbi:hypothetical protein ACKA0G_29070 [Priestia megaterium]|uniref:hypothetical protein n=1 Tax=Priestia megaterium TaxID=1404 RepID=UPI0038A540FB
MRYLVSVNIERIEASEFISINLYDDTGQLADQVVKPYLDIEQAVNLLQEIALLYEQETFEVWTSTPELFAALLQRPGIAVILKHRHDTTDTFYAIRDHEDILRDIYEIKPKSVLPRWKNWLISILDKLKERLENA